MTVNFAYFISKYSKYAVTCLEDEGTSITNEVRSKWYLNEKTFTGTFKTKFGNRVYTISSGVLKKISQTYNNEKVFVDNYTEWKNYVDDVDDLFTNEPLKSTTNATTIVRPRTPPFLPPRTPSPPPSPPYSSTTNDVNIDEEFDF